jgi:opacity protein-like surface antigen
MKRSIVLSMLIAFFGLTNQLHSQFGVELNGGLTVPQDSRSKSDINEGLSGGLGLTYRVLNSLDIMTVVHYHSFSDIQENKIGLFTSKVTKTVEYMPIMVGARYTFSDGGIQPFISGTIGSVNGTATLVATSNIAPESRAERTKTFTAICLGGGVKFKINNQLSLLGMAEYTMLEKDNDKPEMLAIKVGLRVNM